MKKIVSAVVAGTMLAGAAFAEFTVKGNARIYSDAFQYTSASAAERYAATDSDNEGVDDNGRIVTAKDTKHADDVTIEAKGDASGIKIVFNVTSAVQTYNTAETKTDVNLTSYQLWTNIGKVRVDAGAYDQRLAKNLNNDGNWGNDYSRSNKPGIWVNFAGAAWGKDAANITTIKGNKTRTNFQVSGKVSDDLTLRGVVFLSTDGTNTNGTSTTKSERWIFTPFAVGGTYALDKDTQINFNAKLSSYTRGTAAAPGDLQVWTLNGNIYKKLSDALEVEAGYTLGMGLYNDWSGYGSHDASGNPQRDRDVFAHGIDFALKDKLSSELSLTAIGGINYVQATAITRRTNDNTSGAAYRDARAKSYGTGAAGTLAYYATLSVDYKQSDLVTFQVQTKLANSNLFAVSTGDSDVKQCDYYKNLSWNIRPAILVSPDKASQLFAGVDIGFTGFLRNATGANNTLKTTVTIPVGLRVKL